MKRSTPVNMLKVWSTRLPLEHEDLLDQGRQIELLAGDGVLILQRDPEGILHVTWMHQSEAGFGLRARP